MNRTRMWLALATAAWLALPAAAAPAPAPPSEGPIADALGLRGLLPTTAPPLVGRAVMPEEGVIELERRTMAPVDMTKYKAVVQRDGKVESYIAYPVRGMLLMDTQRQRMKADSVKFFTVTKEGKLEALEAAKATGMLKTRTSVLVGESAEVDPRHLELFKPGTLYIVPPPEPPPQTPPPPREDKP